MGIEQCDQMVGYFLIFGHLQYWTLSYAHFKISQTKLEILLNTILDLKELPNTIRISNFGNSPQFSHTGRYWTQRDASGT